MISCWYFARSPKMNSFSAGGSELIWVAEFSWALNVRIRYARSRLQRAKLNPVAARNFFRSPTVTGPQSALSLTLSTHRSLSPAAFAIWARVSGARLRFRSRASALMR